MGSTLSKDTPNPSSGTPPPTSAWQSDQQIDYGSLLPNGIYPGSPQDYDHRVVRRLICDRRLSPFYKGLADEPVSVGDPSEEDTSAQTTGADHTHHPSPAHAPIIKKPESFGKSRERSSSNSSTYSPSGTENAKAKQKLEAERKKLFVEKKLYKDALECPICFLYYPANINHSRCCAQPICTECFVQIKRPPETPSTSASCPFCVEPNFGVYYKPPEWAEKTVEKRAISSALLGPNTVASGSSALFPQNEPPTTGNAEKRPRRKTLSHQDPDVVTTDMIRSDWARVPDPPLSRPGSRRNSAGSSSGSTRRIVVRPNSGATVASRSGRSASSAAAAEYGSYIAAMRHMNMDLEELMVMEAVRLSLLEQEETQRREASTPTTTSDTDNTHAASHTDASVVGSTSTDQIPPQPSITVSPDVSDDDDESDDDEPLVRAARAHRFQQSIGSSAEASTSNSSSFPPRLSSEGVPSSPPPPHEDGRSRASKDVKVPIVITEEEDGERNEGAAAGGILC